MRIKYNVCKAIGIAFSMIVEGTQLIDGSCCFKVDYSTWVEISGKDENRGKNTENKILGR